MAQHVAAEDLDSLIEIANELYAVALAMAPKYSLLAEEDGPQASEMAVRIQASVMAFNALLTAAQLNEPLTMIALGSVCGTALATCQGDRRMLFQALQTQFARVLAEATQSMQPVGTA